MRLHELAHRITTDIVTQVPTELRLGFISFIKDGFDDEGSPIAHADHQDAWLYCLDCTDDCTHCQIRKARELRI